MFQYIHFILKDIKAAVALQLKLIKNKYKLLEMLWYNNSSIWNDLDAL